MRVALKNVATGKYASMEGPKDAIDDASTFDVEFLEVVPPMPLPPPGPRPLPGFAGWWGPNREDLYNWVDAHYLNRSGATPANINYWVIEILAHPGDDPNPKDNEGYWIQQMSR